MTYNFRVAHRAVGVDDEAGYNAAFEFRPLDFLGKFDVFDKEVEEAGVAAYV